MQTQGSDCIRIAAGIHATRSFNSRLSTEERHHGTTIGYKTPAIARREAPCTQRRPSAALSRRFCICDTSTRRSSSMTDHPRPRAGKRSRAAGIGGFRGLRRPATTTRPMPMPIILRTHGGMRAAFVGRVCRALRLRHQCQHGTARDDPRRLCAALRAEVGQVAIGDTAHRIESAARVAFVLIDRHRHCSP